MFEGIDSRMDHNPWLPWIINRINDINEYDPEKYYYALYNSILTLSFPPAERFVVAPQTYPKDSNESTDFSLEYDLFIDSKLIGFLEIKPEYHIRNISHRVSADEQMRRRFRQLMSSSCLETLVGISAIGRYCAVYRFHRSSNILIPAAIRPSDPSTVEDLAPIIWWSINIGDEVGRTELSDVFSGIRSAAFSQISL